MTLTGRPLLDTRADARLFVDRDKELATIRRALTRGLNCAVVGERGSGKTSLVRALMFRARQDKGEELPPLVFVRGSGADSAGELLGRTIRAIDSTQTPGAAFAPQGSAESLLDQLEARTQSLTPRPVVVVDDVPPRAGNELFGALRDELWVAGVTWLVTVSSVDAGALMRPPADAFFESRVEVGELTRSAAMDLLARRLPDQSQDTLARFAGAATGNPRQLLELARDLTADGGSPDLVARYAAREAALAQAGRPAHMLFVELTSIGPSSASDQALQQRMGWTRPRLVQVLGQLEKAGLVSAELVRPEGGQGRPRKVYSPVTPTSFERKTETS
ncbi:MAG: ATP-binding protein [Phycicoccus sp.]|nr:ATP-binding protein [Phycicoccus sp.]